MSRLLIVKPSSLGDIVHALPVCAALAARGHEVHFAARREYRGIVEMCRPVKEILDFPVRLAEVPAFLSDLRSREYAAVIDLQGLLRSALAAACARAVRRMGLPDAREGSLFFYDEVAVYPSAARHAMERYWSVIGRVAGEPPPDLRLADKVDYGLEIPPAVADDARAMTGAGAYVVFSPVARQARKMIRLDVWTRLADILARRKERVVIVGVGQTEMTLGNGAVNLINRTTIPALCAVIARSKMCVSVDSAPMHLAAAFGVPVVSLFGPTDPGKVGPYTTNRMILRSGEPDMRDVTCESVAALVISELERTKRA